MLWEELTSEDFVKSVNEAEGTCVLPIGAIEKHGQHLPLGTDMNAVRDLAERVAEIEPAIVFPYYLFGQICEAKHVAGTISIDTDLILKLLENMCDEISRNGLKKIAILDGHGGNYFFLRFFIQSLLNKKKDYVVYLLPTAFEVIDKQKISELLKGGEMGEHGGNYETSIILALAEQLVKMDRVDESGIKSHGKLDHLGDIYTSIWWYAKHPSHFAGNPYNANKEAGEAIIEMSAKIIARHLRLIKEDDVAVQLQNEFFVKCEDPK